MEKQKRIWINVQTNEIFESRKAVKEKYGEAAMRKMQNLGIIRYIDNSDLNTPPYAESTIYQS